SLHFPDFRAGERTFQLLTQVAGRAGRGEAPGEVVIQSYAPLHYAIQAAREHDYARFFEREIAERRELGYPPFKRAVLIRVTGKDESRVRAGIGRLARAAEAWIAERAPGSMDLLGPAPAPMVKLQGRFRYHVFLKGPSARLLHEAVAALRIGQSLPPGLDVDIDVDPQSSL
ncbi:MAG: primosomal protein N', partial [Myxococcales bacterium]|nr:primosomal protein N' [Myxococcales bacterium]